MRRHRAVQLAVSLAAVLLVLVIPGVGTRAGPAVRADAAAGSLRAHSLLGETPTQLGQYGLEWAFASRSVASGTPTVLLARFVTPTDLTNLGLDNPNWLDARRPLVAVIIRGDLTAAFQPGVPPASAGVSRRATYAEFLFDAITGTTLGWDMSPNGVGFGRALNDPTLPVNRLVVPTVSPGACKPILGPDEPYGTVVKGDTGPAPGPVQFICPTPGESPY